jgi:hypothetical protein
MSNEALALMVMLFVTVSVLAVAPLNCKVAAVPAPTVNELQAAFAFLIRMLIPFGITTLSVRVGTPVGVQRVGVSQFPLEFAVFVVCAIIEIPKKTKAVKNRNLKSLFIN